MMRPYVEFRGCSCGDVASSRGMGAILPLQHGMMDAGVMLPLSGVTLQDTLISSGSVLAAMDDVLAHAQHLNGDIMQALPAIMSTAAGQRFHSDWVAWYSQYQTFYGTHRGSVGAAFSYAVGETVASLRGFAAQYNDFESRYTSISGLEPSYNPTGPGSQILPTEAWVAIGIGAGVLALGFLAWGASSVAKVTAPTRALRGRRR